MDEDCFLLNENELDHIAITRGMSCGLVALISLAATYVVLLRVFCCTRHVEQSQDFFPHAFCTLRCVLGCVCNPMLWTVLAYVATCLAYTAHLWVSFYPDAAVCRWFGFAIQWTESFAMTMSCFLAVYIFYYLLCQGRPLTDNELNTQDLSSKLYYILHSVIVGSVILLLLLGTGGYNLPMFVVKSYGPLGGPWCWIEDTQEQLYFWHFPYWAVQLVTFLTMIANVVVFTCKIATKKAISGKMTGIAVILVLIYAQVLHAAFSGFESIVHLFPNLRCNDATHIFWYIGSIMTPLAKMFTIFAALVLLGTRPLGKKISAEFQPLI